MPKNIQIFNPSHEMAMAHAENYYQPKQRIVQMEQQLAVLPLWWSCSGDWIWVPDAAKAEAWMHQLPLPVPQVQFVQLPQVLQCPDPQWQVWGWNRLLRRQLQGAALLPDDVFLDKIRALSSRQVAVQVLQSFPNHPQITGRAFYCTTPQQVAEAWQQCPYYVLKSLWSSSGRGVMLMQHAEWEQSRQLALSFLKNGGGLVIEPMYEKIQDFAMEFMSDGRGKVCFGGYSSFSAAYGRYAANQVQSQQQLADGLQIGAQVLQLAREHLEKELSCVLGSHYQGPLGVDMMVVHEEGENRLHPCVEINLRRNMGWLAIDLFTNYLAPDSQGQLYTDYCPNGELWQDHLQRLQQQPLVVQQGRIKSGYLALTLVEPDTQYRIRLEVTG